MILFSKLQPNVVYRTKNTYSYPYDIENPPFGNMISIFGTKVSDTGDFFARSFLKVKNYSRYYIEKKLRTEIMGVPYVKNNDVSEFLYESGLRNYIHDIKAIPLVSNLNKRNFVYELGQMEELIFTNFRIEKKDVYTKSNLYMEYYIDNLVRVADMFPDYKKYLFIPIDKYIDNIRDPQIFLGKKYILKENVLVIFLRYLMDNFSVLRRKLSDWNLVFVNVNEIFYISMKDTTDGSVIKNCFRQLRSRPFAVYNKDTDDALFDSEEDELTYDEVKDANKDIKNDVIQNVIDTFDKVDVSDSLRTKVEEKVTTVVTDKVIDQSNNPSKFSVKNTITKTDKLEAKESDKKDLKKDTKRVDKKPSLISSSIIKEKEKPEEKKFDSDILTYGRTQTQRTTGRSTTKPTDNAKETKPVSSKEEPKQITVTKIPEKEISGEKLVSKASINARAVKTVSDTIDKALVPNLSAKRLSRLEKIQKEMDEITIDNKTVQQLAEEAKMKEIPVTNIKADTINKDITKKKFSNFEKSYNEKLFDYDFMNILKSFAEKDRPLYLISLTKEDTSTSLDKIYTYTCVFEDVNGGRHHIVFDLPKFVNDKFIHLNGSDKLFVNQILPLPITKTSADEVQITSSSYNKIFMHRFGKNVSSKVMVFNSVMPDLPKKYIKYEIGNNLIENTEYSTTIEYDELSQKYHTITLPIQNITLYLNQKEILSIIEDSNNEFEYDKDTQLPFGIQELKTGERRLITINVNSDIVDGTELSPIDFIVGLLVDVDESLKDTFKNTKYSSKTMYTRATIMAKRVPLVLLLGFLIGLEPLLNKLNVDYTFSDKVTNEAKRSTDNAFVKFKNGILTYDTKDFSSALILNGLYDIDTESYDFLDFSSKDVYYDIFMHQLGRRNIGNAFENFEQLFIDPITKDILKDQKLPTNFVDLLIYANKLLENNIFTIDGNMNEYRIRSNELINAHLYKVLAKAYERYRITADYPKPTKMSIKRNAVLNDMFDSQLFEEYSTLNPIYEIDRMRATSFKGLVGCNIDDAFKISKRSFNSSMLGIFSQSTPISSNVGIARTLSLNPNVTSLRGYLKSGKSVDKKDLNETNILSGAELLVPMAATHDDPQRVSMASTQSRHTIATVDSDRPLFGYGMDKVLANVVSNRFAFKAKKSGTVSEINENLGYIMLHYDDGTSDVVDITNKQSLNTGSGFYIQNKLTPNLKVGDRFNEDDIVARDASFFDYDKMTGNTIYKSGPLARVAIIHSSSVFEDSTIVTERLAERMGSYVTEMRPIKLGKNSNIYKMAKIGDNVKVGDSLMVIDESYNDAYLNKLLSKMNMEDKDEFIEAARTPIKSKINGKVVDIKIYYTIPKNQLSPSIQTVINNYEKTLRERKKKFESENIDLKNLLSLDEDSGYTEPVNGKVKGNKMDDNVVLVEFYIQTLNAFSVGDKLTYSVALKGVNQSLIPKGKEPELASDPNEKIDAFMSASGYYARMTNSFILSLMLNTIILGAEKKIKDILES